MKTSARNQFSGTVLAVKTGAVNSEISIGLPGGQTLTATVRMRAAKNWPWRRAGR